MKTSIVIALFGVFSWAACAAPRSEPLVHKISISREIFVNSNQPFISHHDAGPFGKALAMNVNYDPVKEVRSELEKQLGYKLKIFTGWNLSGEAHITTITPLEYTNVFSSFVSIQELDDIARAQNIQSADLQIQGIGRGTKLIDGRMEETYFIVVHSECLLKIRREIYRLFVSRGGDAKAWDSEHFFPHITMGFTLRDLHEADGVIKDKAHSLDPRFVLELENK